MVSLSQEPLPYTVDSDEEAAEKERIKETRQDTQPPKGKTRRNTNDPFVANPNGGSGCYWTVDEDNRLLLTMSQILARTRRIKGWTEISTSVGTRSVKQCQRRWTTLCTEFRREDDSEDIGREKGMECSVESQDDGREVANEIYLSELEPLIDMAFKKKCTPFDRTERTRLCTRGTEGANCYHKQGHETTQRKGLTIRMVKQVRYPTTGAKTVRIIKGGILLPSIKSFSFRKNRVSMCGTMQSFFDAEKRRACEFEDLTRGA